VKSTMIMKSSKLTTCASSNPEKLHTVDFTPLKHTNCRSEIATALPCNTLQLLLQTSCFGSCSILVITLQNMPFDALTCCC
jgi:hypothetical protein